LQANPHEFLQELSGFNVQYTTLSSAPGILLDDRNFGVEITRCNRAFYLLWRQIATGSRRIVKAAAFGWSDTGIDADFRHTPFVPV
jgi:hypothetical protein